jgi:hypothetical protein
MPRRALLIGINAYDNINALGACVRDAQAMEQMLRTHEDGRPNYECRLLLGEVGGVRVTRPFLLDACRKLFDSFTGETLLFFAGHGAITQYGGYLCTAEAEADSFGVLMDEVLDIARGSRASDTLIVADCCHAGSLGSPPYGKNILAISENMTIMAGSRAEQVTLENAVHGLFTEAVLDALDGGAADHRGFVTAPAIYAQVESRFGAWGQRPIFKSHATHVPIIRQCTALITRDELAELVLLFPTPNYAYRLDPEYEPEDQDGNVTQPVNVEKVRIAALFKRYRDAGLLRTSGGEQLYWAGRRSTTVALTPRGRANWRLVKGGLA